MFVCGTGREGGRERGGTERHSLFTAPRINMRREYKREGGRHCRNLYNEGRHRGERRGGEGRGEEGRTK